MTNEFELVYKVYDKTYQDKHWKRCRFHEDLRTCGTWIFENGQYVYKVAYYSKKVNSKWVIFCEKDNKKCDAKWIGDKE